MGKDLVESFSGIRGVYGEGLTEQLARDYTFSYCELFSDNKDLLVIGGDSRSSTPSLKKAIINAFGDYGIKRVFDVGVVPIQVAQYAIGQFKAQGGVYITASHNEPEYNGFKFLKQDGALLYPEQSNKLTHGVYNLQELPAKSDQGIEVAFKQDEAIQKYVDYVINRIGQKSVEVIKQAHLKILLDPNGGSAINVLNRLFNKLGVEAKIINDQLGEFKHTIEPNAQTLTPLGRELENGEYQFACGFDCDADRVEIVIPPNSSFAKEMGVALSGNYVLALACDIFLEGTDSQVVVNNDASSYLVRDVIDKYKAKVVEVEVGEMNVVKEMESQKSIIGGEGSCGGVIIPPIKCRDGMMTIVLFLKMLANSQKSLPEILDSYTKYYLLREKVQCSPENVIKFKENFEKYFKDQGYRIQKTGDQTGGLKAVADENNFVWCRQSKTEPGTFRIWADGKDKEKVKSLLNQAIEIFKNN